MIRFYERWQFVVLVEKGSSPRRDILWDHERRKIFPKLLHQLYRTAVLPRLTPWLWAPWLYAHTVINLPATGGNGLPLDLDLSLTGCDLLALPQGSQQDPGGGGLRRENKLKLDGTR
eukprot:s887_g15.t1